MPFTMNDGVRIYWDSRGEGTPLLLIMGHRYTSRMWWPVLPALTEQHRVIWFDNRGTGETDSPKTASVAEMTSDALAVMDAAGVDSAHVWGVSMGGGIAQQVAITAPERVRSLILGCTTIKTEVTKDHKLIGSIMTRLPVGAYKLMGWKALYGNIPPEMARQDWAVLSKDKISPRGVVAQSTGIAEFSMTLEDAARISVPTLVQHGTEDRAVPYAAGVQLAETIPGARLETYEGAPHNYLLMDAERVKREVLDFLGSVDATVSA